jgi:hypothetical protein
MEDLKWKLAMNMHREQIFTCKTSTMIGRVAPYKKDAELKLILDRNDYVTLYVSAHRK